MSGVRVLLAAAVVCVLAGGAAARAATTAVFPTGLYPDDVQNVQAAVDEGGIVMLKSTSAAGEPTAFNFGPATRGPGFVTLSRDVKVIGEHHGSAVTTVRGGYYPVRGFDATKTTIQGIDFEGPLRGALIFLGPAGADTEIVGNRIAHVAGLLFPGFGTTAEAMVIGGGRVVIDDNVVVDLAAKGGIGITELDSAGPVEITGNTISGTRTNSIEATRNHGSVTIADNEVRPGPENPASPSGAVGIEINGTGAYHVERNDVLIEDPYGIGIFAFGALGFGFGAVTAPVIEKNRIVLDPAASGVAPGDVVFDDGIDLGGLVSYAKIAKNKIEGTGSDAFAVFDASFDPVNQPSDLGFNAFVDNNIEHLDTVLADVFLDTASHDTTFKGKCRTLIDLGTNNKVTCSAHGGRGTSYLQARAATMARDQAALAVQRVMEAARPAASR
jgi:hypothetical protein